MVEVCASHSICLQHSITRQGPLHPQSIRRRSAQQLATCPQFDLTAKKLLNDCCRSPAIAAMPAAADAAADPATAMNGAG
jgi:hypothetical protein